MVNPPKSGVVEGLYSEWGKRDERENGVGFVHRSSSRGIL